MEPRFENRYVVNQQMISEFVRKVLCRNTTIIAIVLAILAEAMAYFTFTNQQIFYTIVFAVLGLALLIMGIMLCPVMIKKYMKAANTPYGRNKQTVIRFYDYSFDIQDGSFAMDFDYRKVYRIYDLQYSYVLMFTKGNGIMLKKDGFTLGTFDAFTSFIKGRCNRAVLPK